MYVPLLAFGNLLIVLMLIICGLQEVEEMVLIFHSIRFPCTLLLSSAVSAVCLLLYLLFTASFISPEKGRKMLPTPVGTASGTSLLGPSLLDGNSRDSFVSRSLADVAEVRVCVH